MNKTVFYQSFYLPLNFWRKHIQSTIIPRRLPEPSGSFVCLKRKNVGICTCYPSRAQGLRIAQS